MAGRKFKPPELKILRMTSKKAEKLVKKITPTPGPLVEAPPWLTEDQKGEWAYAIENAPHQILKKIDKSVLAGYIIAQDTHRKASMAMQQHQLLVKSPDKGILMQNPYLPIVNRQMMLMLRAASELGFTPCARARIDAGKTPATELGDWEDVAVG